MSTAKRKIGPFEIEGKLGSGGMGAVYLATYQKTGQKVALKVLPPELSGDQKLLARFAREMEILQKLRHPRIVRYLGGGKAGTQHFYAMELMTGGTLEQALKKRGRLSWEQTIEWGMQLCEALQHAHEHGIVHRDLKPANLFLTRDGQLKLGDFGIARDLDATALTAAGRTVGTYAYMAPEQITGKHPISAKTDLYALGCVLFQMLAGRPPYEAETPPEMMFKHIQEEPPRVMPLAVDCPIWLESIIVRLLNKNPDERYYDAMAVYVALEEVGRNIAEQASITRQSVVGGATAVATQIDQKELKKLIGSKRKKKKKKQVPIYERGWFLSACLLLLMAGLTWSLWPASEEKLYAQAQPLMASDELSDWINARDQFLQPMLDRYPDGTHADEAREFLDQIDMRMAETQALRRARLNREPESEAERLFVEARRFEQFGDRIAAREKYSGLATLFADKEQARPFVNLAKRQIAAIDQAGAGEHDRVALVNGALQRAEEHRTRGELLKAQEVWRSVVSLYAGNTAFEPQVKYARARLDGREVDELEFDPTAPSEEPETAEAQELEPQ